MRRLVAVCLLSTFFIAACGPATGPDAVVSPPRPTASAAPAPASTAKVVQATLQSVGLDPLAMDRQAGRP
jgi:hypothetical protein